MGERMTGEELDILLDEGKLNRIGDGSRRVCMEIPGSGLCLKCYRYDEKTKPWLVPEIERFRHDPKRNTCCQEYRQYLELKRSLPKYVFAAFPERCELVHLPKRGWAIVESTVLNADGSPVRKFAVDYRAADESRKEEMMRELRLLIWALVAYRVRFYDPQNVMVQNLADGSFRLRVVDFEPGSRTLLPVDRMFPALAGRKTLRRAKRFVKGHFGADVRHHSLKPKTRRMWDAVIENEGAAIGLSDCREFLENKFVNDIFYQGEFEGRPCIVKCSSKAPESIENEYNLSRKLFAVDPRSCAEPLALWKSPDGKHAFVVLERLPGPSLFDLRKGKTEALAERADSIAGDFMRIADALAASGIVHRDMGTMDNYMMGADGHFRLIDFQFAVDRNEARRDPWLRRHPVYHYVIFSGELDGEGCEWNDVRYLVDHLERRIPKTESVNAAAGTLAARIEKSAFRATFSLAERMILKLYRMSLRIQLLVRGKRGAKASSIQGRLHRMRNA